MKKLFLLPVFALAAIMAMSIASAGCCDLYFCANHNACSGTISQTDCVTRCNGLGQYAASPVYCDTGTGICAPEFTTIGAGIALAGAGLGYAFIRRKRK